MSGAKNTEKKINISAFDKEEKSPNSRKIKSLKSKTNADADSVWSNFLRQNITACKVLKVEI
ncbi:hypothetical protein DERF_008431 [Dermatophagoides farinae]|uniref:Uncharacterized protein n=1 Tax=Dermatophagoides farinae TaxID=6954 RepID=A0A922I4F5_DERFA|nr:hypothetical protein DERF_008431 [Dermatophagoides farinae]